MSEHRINHRHRRDYEDTEKVLSMVRSTDTESSSSSPQALPSLLDAVQENGMVRGARFGLFVGDSRSNKPSSP